MVAATDAHIVSFGAVLFQVHRGVTRKPVTYVSRPFTDTVQRYAGIEKEIFGVT